VTLRRTLVPLLLVVVGIGLFVGGVGLWARGTLYNSGVFARRVSSMLDSQDVRHEISTRLTEQLVRNGNQQAISFRPAFETGIESALETDTFRSIFRGAIRTAHADLLHGGSGGGGINLSESVSVVASTLRLSGSDPAQEIKKGSFASSFSDVTTKLGDLGIWDLDDTITTVSIIAIVLAVAAAVGAVALSGNRRRTIWWIGWTVASVGVFVGALLWVAGWYAELRIKDDDLGRAVRGAIANMTVDLRTMALWTIVYGVVIAGAAATAERRYRVGDVVERSRGWLDRRRRTMAGTILVAAGAVIVGFLVLYNPLTAAEVVAVAIGIGLTYVGSVEIIGMVRRVTVDNAHSAWWRPVLLVGTVVVVLAAATVAVVATTSRSARSAADEEATGCNGSDALCDERLDQAMFPSTHNSMSSPLYPGWLFGEQIGTISDQLNAGIRGFLIDTHYGIPSSSRMPGSQTPVILTDRAHELSSPDFEQADPAVVERADALQQRAPKAANAKSSIYLCHNYCELGAVKFSTVLQGIKNFIDTHPFEVIIIDIQDATAPADTAQAFIDAGLEDYIATLDPDKPLPTLGELIDDGKNLVVFAERGGTGAPPWYQSAYNGWLQETKYTFPSLGSFDCLPNRGGTNGKLFLVNHWVTTKGPSPSTAAKANDPDLLLRRIEQCIKERKQLPNMVAVDYGQASAIVDLLAEVGPHLLDEIENGPSDETTTSPSSTSVPDNDEIATLTGGDPATFCDAVPEVLQVVTGYGEALLSERAETTATTDALYAPWLVEVLTPYINAAPKELAARAQPMLDRATAAITATGLDQPGSDDVVAAGRQALAARPDIDGVTLRSRLQATFLQHVKQDALDAATKELGPTPGDLFVFTDLGFVDPDVASKSGFACL
jgi:hypothetical protein